MTYFVDIVLQCLLYETPESIYDSEWSAEQKPLGIPGEKQCLNASLAAQVSDIWVQNHTKGNCM